MGMVHQDQAPLTPDTHSFKLMPDLLLAQLAESEVCDIPLEWGETVLGCQPLL